MTIFIDCGTNEKQGLMQIVSMNQDIDTVYSFEANTIVYDSIDKSDGVNYYNIAVSDKFGFCDFYVEKDITKGDRYISGGSRMQDPRYGLAHLFDGDKTYNIGAGKQTNDMEEFVSDMYIKTVVPTIRLVDFINYLNVVDHSIILKLDVEGCEYAILEDMKKSNTFNKIKKLYIEFHEWARTPDHKTDVEWINYFKENNIDYNWWH